MVRLLTIFRALVAWTRGCRASRDAEILFLRQQLLVLKRSTPKPLRLRNSDRLIFVWLYHLFSSLLDAAVIFKPETLCAGIVAVFVCSGTGSHAEAQGVRRYQAASAVWFAG